MSKIVHISTVHTAFDQRIFHRECVTLSKAGYDVSLLAYTKRGGVFKDVKLVSLGDSKRRVIGTNLFNRLKRSRHAFNTSLGIKADLYHFHDPELIGIGLKLKKKTNACVIYDCHEDNAAYMLQKHYIPALVRRVMAAIIKYQERRAALILDAIITADKGVSDCFINYKAKKTICLENFPRLDLFLNKTCDAAPQYDIVYHGTIPKYHLETCFAVDSELVKKAIKPSWLFIGKCAEIAWAKERVKKIKAGDRIIFKDPVPHEEIAKWVRLGRIGIIPLPNYPKFHRNIPTKLFEFMALGMPVVLSNLPPSRPFVGDGRCAIMVDPNSPVDYANAIEDLLKNPHRCVKMGTEGRRRVASNYNWESSAEKLLNLYKELLCTKS
jgi:glycosyltransferase involved in cell wall biosynthesis